MLSDRLEAMASHFRAWAEQAQPLELNQRVSALIAAQLADAAGQARALEGRPVPPPARGELPAGVIPFRRRAA
ncbi:hypothetical protein [Rubritepida flocculans]|uniref:hypothetical protein n=1 Tax=Rubritepida flocculans TaxID=182403 RepID=UPI000400DEE6|nr:hypothetical protein [Rubritepida flocculans]